VTYSGLDFKDRCYLYEAISALVMLLSKQAEFMPTHCLNMSSAHQIPEPKMFLSYVISIEASIENLMHQCIVGY
jgi:hypothetical protein